METAKKRDPACPFAQLVYQLLVVEKIGKVPEVAAALKLSQDTLYGRLRSRSKFRPVEIRGLVEALDDQRLLRFFADDSRFVVARRPQADDASHDIRKATAHALHEAIDLMQIIVSALEDGPMLHHDDRAAILNEVKEAETAIANLREAVTAVG